MPTNMKDELEEKLIRLREEYKNSNGVTKKIIAARGKLIKWAIELKKAT